MRRPYIRCNNMLLAIVSVAYITYEKFSFLVDYIITFLTDNTHLYFRMFTLVQRYNINS